MHYEMVGSISNYITKSFTRRARRIVGILLDSLAIIGIVGLVALLLMPQASEWLEWLIWWFIN